MANSYFIQRAIQFIENNLHEDLSLEITARFVGFSKYHFHRIFQKETGITVSEYIRYRRIANSANMLLYSEKRIIDIAIYYRFETQESFTRSFKRYYELPPGQYRKFMSKLTMKREESLMEKEQEVKGWQLSGSHPFHYKMGLDRKIFHKGTTSGYLKSTQVQSLEEFATGMQQFKAKRYLGKRLKLSGFLTSKNVEQFCAIWMRVDDALGDVLQFDNMSNRPITGDTEWNHYSIVLDIPENSAVIAFGVLLAGKGQVWMDELKFEIVDNKVPTTNIDFSVDLLDEPINLSFEE